MEPRPMTRARLRRRAARTLCGVVFLLPALALAAPTATINGPYAINEGSVLNLDATGSTNAVAWRWDLDNDGQYDDATGETPAVAWSTLAGLGVTDGAVTIGLEVEDGAAATDSATTTLTITNLDPVADGGGPYGINEGEDLTLNGSGSTDPGDDALTYAWDVDNDGQYDDATGVSPTVTWATLSGLGVVDGAGLTIGLEVTDTESATNTATATLTITNLDPAADGGGPYSITEGDDLALDGSGSTDPGGDTLTYAWDVDNDGQYNDATGVSPTVTWATLSGLGVVDGTGLTIGLEVTDTESATNTATATLTITNAPPTVDHGGPYTMNEGASLVLDATGTTDPGGDTLTYSWDLNNDGTFGDATGDNPTLSWAALSVFILDGTNTIGLRVGDTGNTNNETVDVTTTVTITNLVPVPDGGGPYAIDEGQDLVLDA